MLAHKGLLSFPKLSTVDQAPRAEVTWLVSNGGSLSTQCEYLDRVKAVDSCPSRPLTVCGATFSASSLVANVCRRVWGVHGISPSMSASCGRRYRVTA